MKPSTGEGDGFHNACCAVHFFFPQNILIDKTNDQTPKDRNQHDQPDAPLRY